MHIYNFFAYWYYLPFSSNNLVQPSFEHQYINAGCLRADTKKLCCKQLAAHCLFC